MKIQATKSFYSRKLRRIVKKGEIVFGPEGWCNSISDEGLGIIMIDGKKKVKRGSQKVETASVEGGEQR